MAYHKRWLKILVLSIILSGCNSDESNTPLVTTDPDKPLPKPVEILQLSGRAGLGVDQGATVTAYPLIAGDTLSTQSPLAQTTVNSQGRFELTFPSSHNGPLVMVLEAQAGQMRCLQVEGCGDQAFGQLDPTQGPVQLALAIEQPKPDMDYHIGLLSELAAQAAMERISEDSRDASLKVSAENSRIASVFRMAEHIAVMPNTALWDPSQVAIAPARHYTNTATELALLHSCRSVLPGDAPIMDAVQTCTRQYLDAGFPGRASTPENEVDLAQVLDRAVSLLDYGLQHNDGLSLHRSQLASRQGVLRVQPVGLASPGTVSAFHDRPAQEQAKNLTKNVRQVVASLALDKLVDFKSLGALVSGDSSDSLEAFGVQVETSELFQGERTDRAMAALKAVLLGSIDSIGQYYGMDILPTDEIYLSPNHEISEDVHRLHFTGGEALCRAEPKACGVALEADLVLSFGAVLGNERFQILTIEEMAASFDIHLSVDGYDLSVVSEETSTAEMIKIQQGENSDTDPTTFIIQQAEIQLPIEIDSSHSEGVHTFDGNVAFRAREFIGTYKREESQSEEGSTTIRLDQTRFVFYALEGISADLLGQIASPSSEDFYASINFTQNLSGYQGMLNYTSTDREVCSDGGCETESSTETDGETEDNFFGFSTSATYKANLQGVRDPVQLQISGARSGPDNTAINYMKASYPGTEMEIDGNFNSAGGITSLNVINHDGIELDIKTVDGERVGQATGPAGERVAQVIDMGQWVKILFEDDYFESL